MGTEEREGQRGGVSGDQLTFCWVGWWGGTYFMFVLSDMNFHLIVRLNCPLALPSEPLCL